MKSSTKKESDNIQDKYDNLYLSLKNKNDYRKVLILIEGPDDLRIYSLLLDPEKVVLDAPGVTVYLIAAGAAAAGLAVCSFLKNRRRERSVSV